MMTENPLGPLDAILGLHVRLAHGAIQRHFAENAAGLGLTQKQISVAWLVHANPGIGQADLARRLQMDRATTMAIVHSLERLGLLARARAADARRVALRLTDRGSADLAAARAAVAAHEGWLRERFTPEEAETLATLLRRIHA